MSDELTEWGKSDDAASYWMAECYALIGQVDETLTWVANAARLGWINHPWLSKHDPLLENVRDDPRYQELMEQVKSEWEAIDA